MRHQARLVRAAALVLLALASACCTLSALAAQTTQPQETTSQVNKSQDSSTTRTVTNETEIAKHFNNVQPNQQLTFAPLAANCSRPCTNAEFASILNKISLNVDIFREFQRSEVAPQSQVTPANNNNNRTSSTRADLNTIRPGCIKQLIKMIKNLASGELEMKTLLEFASSTGQINTGLRSDLSFLRSKEIQSDAEQAQAESCQQQQQQQRQVAANQANPNDQSTEVVAQQRQPEYLLGDEVPGSAGDLEAKMSFLPKLVASVDQWLDTIERFTVTREWSALTRVVTGLESILGMFAAPAPAQAAGKGAHANATNEMVAQLERELPRQVRQLTGSLNQLFPWHVWPWNNIDLYSTIDTFLNHGIFAFSKTTSGPERRIDYLPQMLEALFKSLGHDSFPKKCYDWSRIICDLELFYDRLALTPLSPDDAPTEQARQQRQAQVRDLMGNNKNKLTQELVCIMFSSLSMQQFGGTADLNATSGFDAAEEAAHQHVGEVAGAQAQQSLHNSNQLKWDRQIRKAVRLYKLSREALSDDQWRALQKQLNSLWSQMKISDRVIMIGRIVQLLTNCHMPREILESALWKDIYKYKNALNQASDIVIEELNRSAETGQFTIERLALGSKHLEDILVRFVRLLPRLIEALSRTVTDQLPELVSKFFDEKTAFFKGPCKGHSFGQLVPSLAPYHEELSHLERLVCQQLRTKPSITMMQINNLTNEILAMAFNFTNFGGSAFPGLPRLWSGGPGEQVGAAGASPNSGSVAGAGAPGEPKHVAPQAAKFVVPEVERQDLQSNGTSIIDELAANPRLAQIVAILQSSALDPPEVHAELPELDWVEAGTSVALFYESIQKLMSYEGLFVVFPEVANFQEDIGARLETSKQMFAKFGKRDPIKLTAYLLDTVMPVALRTFQSLDSFHSECLSTFRDIFGETESLATQSMTGQPLISRESRQWQCAVSTTNFVSYALNNLVATFNGMLRNILAQMSRQRDMFKFNKQQQQQQVVWVNSTSTSSSSPSPTNSSTCVLFDGSVTTLMDNLPHLVDLALETVLIASTNFNQRPSLKETLCSFESVLDPLDEQQLIQRQLKLREAVCHLLHESSLATCSDALKVDAWTSTMKELNVTWFEMNALNVEPSFRGILVGAHEFMDLFGKVKPSSMSDGLIARVLNFNSYWTSLVNKAMSSFEKYKERRFQVALQILMPIIYENLPAFQQTQAVESEELKHGLKTSVLAAHSLLVYLGKSDSAQNSTSNSGVEPAQSSARALVPAATNDADNQDQIDAQLRALFDWSDRYSLVISETLMRTCATNITKLESLISTANGEWDTTWNTLCTQPIDTYLEFDLPATSAADIPANKAGLPSHARLADMQRAHEFVCRQFDWHGLERRMYAHTSQQVNHSTATTTMKLAGNSSPTSAVNLNHYSTRQLVRVALTKWGQVMDLVVGALSGPPPRSTRLPKLLSISHWQQLQARLPSIAPAEQDPSNFIWVWRALERLINKVDQQRQPAVNQTIASNSTSSAARTSDALVKIFDQLNCALDTVKGGMTWENMVNIYQDRQDVLAAHSTLNNGIALASAGANTFLAHKKFQKFLDSFVKPHLGLTAFCEMRDKTRLESVFSLDSTNLATDGENTRNRDELVAALESFQEFICDTNIESLVANVNPISVCYQNSSQQQMAPLATAKSTDFPLAETIERFFKLASLAILDAKLVDTNDAKPPIFNKNHWDQLRTWWFNQTEVHQGNSGLALTLVRLFQTLDSINSEHVVWRAIFGSVHELSEVAAYLLRATEMERQANLEMRERGQPTRFALIREAAELVDGALKSAPAPASVAGANNSSTASGFKFGRKQQQLASTMANVLFPETSNFISLRTFKQLRYIKSISEYFATATGAQELICQNLTQAQSASASATSNSTDHVNIDQEEEEDPDQQPLFTGGSKLELLDYKLNTSKRLYSLLCHYQSSQWLTAMNIVLSSKTSSLTKKVNYMTKYLSIFTKNFKHNENLQSFIHGQQLENIEAVANKTVSYLIALSQPFRTLTLSKISNISWYSIPALLDSIDKHLCASKYEQQQQQQQQTNSSSEQSVKNNNTTTQYSSGDPTTGGYQLAVYEPKKPDIEVIICKLPSWNITQVYNYFSENIDLQNMISLATQDNSTAKLLGISVRTTSATGHRQAPVCITPFKFASKWLAIVQQLIDEAMSKSSKDRIKKCLSLNKKGQSAYVQTMRYVRILNSLLATLDDLTRNNSWPMVRKTWNSISFAILNQSGSTPIHSAQSALQVPMVAAANITRIVSSVHTTTELTAATVARELAN